MQMSTYRIDPFTEDLKSHPKDWWGPGLNPQPLVYMVNDLSTTPQPLPFAVVGVQKINMSENLQSESIAL